MSFFNLDENMILETISNALESAGINVSEEQFFKITNAIDDSFPGIIEMLTYGMQEHWKDEARNVSTGWGKKYANAIKASVSGNRGEVFIDEDLIDKESNKPNLMYVKMVEEGMKSFSIKKALLKSEKAKRGRDGIKYITILFPVATPRKPGQGKMAQKFNKREMTEKIYKIVKSGGKITSEEKLKSGQEATGLTRYVTRQRHSQYGMFRRVSEKSQGWIHPGVPEESVFPKILEEVNRRIETVLREYCKNIVREFTM